MNFLAAQTRVIERLDEAATSAYWTLAEIKEAINKGQRLFAFLTLCLEETKTFELSANTTFYTPSSDADFADYLFPLRVTVSGRRLYPTTIHELNGRNANWRVASGTPTHYVAMGFDLLAVTPRPTAVGTSLIMICAVEPAALVNDADIPEIPVEHHQLLPDFAHWWLHLKVGGVELQNATQYLVRFLDGASKYAEFTRSRMKANQYDVGPMDLRTVDFSKLFKMALPRQSLPQGMRAA